MKNYREILPLTLLLFVISLTTNAQDTTAPVITLTTTTVNHILGEAYSDSGVTASDDVDGDLTANIVVGGDTVNVTIAGTYTITYNVSDATGNPAIQKTKVVTVGSSFDITVGQSNTAFVNDTWNVVPSDNPKLRPTDIISASFGLIYITQAEADAIHTKTLTKVSGLFEYDTTVILGNIKKKYILYFEESIYHKHIQIEFRLNAGVLEFRGVNPQYIAAGRIDFSVGDPVATYNNSTFSTSAYVLDLITLRFEETIPPVIPGSSPKAVSIAENATIATVVYDVEATDKGGAADVGITYSLSGTDASQFAINRTTGVITLTQTVDYETKTSYSFVVSATDVFNNTSTQTVAVTVTDVTDETAPVIPGSSSKAVSIAENAPIATVVYDVQATNNGGVADAGITYSLLGTDAGDFNITTTGAITLKLPADYETKLSYSFIVLATNAIPNSTAQRVTVMVTDVDEIAPIISGGTIKVVTIAENEPITTVVYNVEATDNGGATDIGIAYSLSGTDENQFAINTATGEITLKSPADYETKSSYNLVVTATDVLNNASTQNVTVTVIDVNEAPVLVAAKTKSVAENTTAVGTYTATDPEGKPLFYALTGADASFFRISSSGVITFATAPDFETPLDAGTDNIYDISLEVADVLGPTNITPSATISTTVSSWFTPGTAANIILITDGNKNASIYPQNANGRTITFDFTKKYTEGSFLYYNSPRTATLIPDRILSSVVEFNLGGITQETQTITTDTDLITITPSSTVVFDQVVLTFTGNDQNFREIEIFANDAGSKTTHPLAVTVTDVSGDIAPIILGGLTKTIPIIENTPISTTVYDVESSVDSGTVDAGITYSISGTDASLFTLNTATGVITLIQAADYETKSSYNFTVAATTSTTGTVSYQKVTIMVTDVDDTAPVIPGSSSKGVSLAENTPITTVLYDVEATDNGGAADVGITYSLSGTDADDFTITTAGAIKLKSPANYEIKSSYSFVVTATDVVGNASTQTVTVAVTDVDEVTLWIGGGRVQDPTDSNNWSNGIPNSNSIVNIGTSDQITLNAAITAHTVNIASGGSLIAKQGVAGVISYARNLATTNEYLISSPVKGQGIDAFSGRLPLLRNGNNLSIASYNNTTGDWSYYQSGTSSTAVFLPGSGRFIKLTAAPRDLLFTGTFNSDDVSIPITINLNGYNLIGNPYFSHISTDEVLTINKALLAEHTIWIWDQSGDDYQIYNSLKIKEIAPAQGFFVSAKSSGNFSITEAMQSHTVDTFQKRVLQTKVELSVSNGTSSKETDIFYVASATTGLDNGYDSSIFSGTPNAFEFYTHAVANGNGEKLGIQALPNSNYETTIVPIGVKAVSGSSLSFSAKSINLPAGIYTYLEDKLLTTFTRIDTASYQVMLSSDLDGVGRFYLHTRSNALSFQNYKLENVSVYVADKRTLQVEGIHGGEAKLGVYNILGKQLLNSSFTGTGNNSIGLPNLPTGTYLVKIQSEAGVLNKKIIIE